MDILYTKKIEKIEIELRFKSENNQSYWRIYLNSPSVSQLLIGEYVKVDKKIAHNEGDIKKQLIIGDIAINKNKLYIIMYRFDEIYFDEFVFSDDKNYECNEFYIGRHIRGSYLNFGNAAFRAQSKLYNDNIYIMADYCGLMYFDSQKRKLFQYTFFDTPQNVIKSDNKGFIYKNKFIKTIQDLSNKQKYTLYEITNIEEIDLINISEDKRGYVLFEKNDLLHEKISKNIVEQYIKDVLTQYEDASIKSVSFLWVFSEYRNEDISCIFYQVDDKSDLNIIRYKNTFSEWMISNYAIKEIKK